MFVLFQRFANLLCYVKGLLIWCVFGRFAICCVI